MENCACIVDRKRSSKCVFIQIDLLHNTFCFIVFVKDVTDIVFCFLECF